jgi:hypothetical protein
LETVLTVHSLLLTPWTFLLAIIKVGHGNIAPIKIQHKILEDIGHFYFNSDLVQQLNNEHSFGISYGDIERGADLGTLELLHLIMKLQQIGTLDYKWTWI